MSQTFTVPATDEYTSLSTGGKYRMFAGDIIPLDQAIDLQMAGTAGYDLTATADGTGTGIVPSEGFFTVAADSADDIVTLPTPDPGIVVALRNGATEYELRSSNPQAVAINGGSGADAESAIPAATLVVCACDSLTTWLCSNTATDGTVSATEVAA